MWTDTTTLPRSWEKVVIAVGEDGYDTVDRISLGMYIDKAGWKEIDGNARIIPVKGLVYFWMPIPPTPEISA